MNYLTPKAKIDQIRQAYIAGNVDPKLLCARVGLSVITVRKYLAEFRVIEQTYPARLRDVYFRLPRVKWVAPAPERYRQLIAALPGLMEEVRTTTIEIELLWKDYREKYPEGYSLEQFRVHVMAWKKQHNICRYWHRRVKYISDEDLTTLNNWRSFSPENWKTDNHGRQISYFRLAVTDRCNLRCFYCMPEHGLDWLSRNELMSYEEMLRICSLLVDMGIDKIRITGGEPLVRKDNYEIAYRDFQISWV